ncbi:MAG TPA: hypothetical protein VEK08_17505 [Planctomycetota bacterium]|nr:hypothetical protein [Planctomycetota bacterium]
MKLSALLALPFVFALSIVPAFAADKEEKVEIKSENKDGKSEFKMKVKKKDKDYVGVSGDKEYILRGESVSTIKSEGEYTVYGDISADGRYIETRSIEPVVVHRDVKVEEPIDVKVEERPVIREREVEVKKEPLVKLPGVEINP